MHDTRRAFVGALGSTVLAGCFGATPSEENETDGGGDDHGTDGGDDHGTDDGGGDHDHGSGDGHGSDDDGGHHDHVEPAEERRANAEVAVGADGGNHFDPHLVWIESGGTVTWSVEGGSHTVTAYHPAADRPNRLPEGAEGWDSGTLAEGETYERTFDEAGAYDYFCVPHEGSGMVGTVLVGEPDPHGAPGLAEPQSSLPDEARSVLAAIGEATNETLGHEH